MKHYILVLFIIPTFILSFSLTKTKSFSSTRKAWPWLMQPPPRRPVDLTDLQFKAERRNSSIRILTFQSATVLLTNGKLNFRSFFTEIILFEWNFCILFWTINIKAESLNFPTNISLGIFKFGFNTFIEFCLKVKRNVNDIRTPPCLTRNLGKKIKFSALL